jgi:adenylate cyclase
MKSCPTCHQTFENDALKFCRHDGAVLVTGAGNLIESEPAPNWSDLLVDTLPDVQVEPPAQGAKRVSTSVAVEDHQEFPATLKLKSGTIKKLASVAVLRFLNESNDRENEYFSQGLADEILISLTRLEGLRVAARASAFSFAKGSPVSEVGRALDVGSVLEGSVKRINDQLEVRVRLIDVANGHEIWTGRYDRTVKDIFDVQNEIVLAVANVLKVGNVDGSILVVAPPLPTENLASYELYLKGRHQFHKATADAWEKGASFFIKATEKDPGNASAFAGLASCYCALWLNGLVRSEQIVPKWKSATMRSLAIDETSPEARLNLANLTFYYEWSWDEAEREYGRTLELDPRNSDALQYFAMFLAARRRFDEAIAYALQALSVDPRSLLSNQSAGWVYYFANRPEEALAQVHKMTAIEPRHDGAYGLLGTIHVSRGSYEEAVEAFKQALSMGGGQVMLSMLCRSYALTGKRDEANGLVNLLMAMNKHQYISPYNIARVYNGLEDEDKSFEWLQKACQERSSELVFFELERTSSSGTAHGKSFANDERVTELLRSVGLLA